MVDISMLNIIANRIMLSFGSIELGIVAICIVSICFLMLIIRLGPFESLLITGLPILMYTILADMRFSWADAIILIVYGFALYYLLQRPLKSI